MHHYDDDGRLVRSVTYHEAEWTDIDRALALAFDIVEAELCPCGCGQPAELAWDDDNDGWFEVDPGIVCHARNALEQWRQTDGKDAEAGVLPVIRFTKED